MTYQITRPALSGRSISYLTRPFAFFYHFATWLCAVARDNWVDWNSPIGLPHDMLEEECTTVICFKLSVALNIWTGGYADMTFSARCFGAKRSAPMLTKWFWAMLVALIDLSCAVLRGEAYHCEAAWRNHMAR